MVLGRITELKYLNTYYDRSGSQIIVAYGQKNTGKTSIVRQFVSDKPYYYYRARSASEREQLYQWGNELGMAGIKVLRHPSFTDIFQAVANDRHAKKVLIIDEFQHIVKSSNAFIKELVSFVHSQWNSNQVMVVLCSSSIGFIENNLITRIGESAYELAGFLKIKEQEYETMFEYFQGFRMEECIEAYSILGGVPGLWGYFDDKLSIKENICRHILRQGTFLQKEGERIVAEELRETSVYNTILAAIAAGNHKLNDLYLHTEFSRAKISVYLKNLMELELVEKVFSYDTQGKENVQKGIYRISNHLVNFYFTYLYPYASSLEYLTPVEYYKKYILPTFKGYVADYFKQVCTQQLEEWNKHGRLPFFYERSGEWVGKVGNIDFIGQDEKDHTLIALCNYDKPMMTYDDYEWLLFCAEKAKLEPDYIYLFSVGRFDEKLNLEAKVKHNLRLIGVDEL